MIRICYFIDPTRRRVSRGWFWSWPGRARVSGARSGRKQNACMYKLKRMYMHAEQCSWLHTRCRSKAVMSSLCRTRTCHLPNTLSRGMSRAGAHSQQACCMHPRMLYRAALCHIIILNGHLSFLRSASPRLVVVSLAARRTEKSPGTLR